MPEIFDPTAVRGADVIDRDGDRIGSVDELYTDQETDKPEWVAVKTGLFGSRLTLVPLAEATFEGDALRVPYEKSHVKDAPNVDADGRLSQEEEAQLYSHFGLDYGEARSNSGLPEGNAGTTGNATGTVGHDVSGPTTDSAMTRSEEELNVGKRSVESGRARLRKFVTSEQVSETVPVQREEARVEREPITDANIDDAVDGPAISEEEHEVVLSQEEPVAEKKVVPKERIRLDKDTITDERTVSDDVRREQVEVEGDTRTS